jgi:hypothetical protein
LYNTVTQYNYITEVGDLFMDFETEILELKDQVSSLQETIALLSEDI